MIQVAKKAPKKKTATEAEAYAAVFELYEKHGNSVLKYLHGTRPPFDREWVDVLHDTVLEIGDRWARNGIVRVTDGWKYLYTAARQRAFDSQQRFVGRRRESRYQLDREGNVWDYAAAPEGRYSTRWKAMYAIMEEEVAKLRGIQRCVFEEFCRLFNMSEDTSEENLVEAVSTAVGRPVKGTYVRNALHTIRSRVWRQWYLSAYVVEEKRPRLRANHTELEKRVCDVSREDGAASGTEGNGES